MLLVDMILAWRWRNCLLIRSHSVKCGKQLLAFPACHLCHGTTKAGLERIQLEPFHSQTTKTTIHGAKQPTAKNLSISALQPSHEC